MTRDEERSDTYRFKPPPVPDILEPHASLSYVAKLFKVMAVLLLLLLVAEVAIGLSQDGAQAIPLLIVQGARLIVFAALLWGGGDLAMMFIETNHDIRATRVLVWQLSALTRIRMESEGLAVDPVNPHDLELTE